MATFNVELARDGPGLLLRDIRRGDDAQIAAVVATIATADADVIALQGVDYDLDALTLTALAEALETAGAVYPHHFAAPPNAGRMTDVDLDGDGRLGGARDAQGFGRFFGQGAMALLSRYPIMTDELRDFSGLLWRDLPGNLYPMTGNGPFGGDAAYELQRLSSNGHWVVPVAHPRLGRLDILTYHATPPVFDGPEDRNGRRNHDETAFWSAYLDGVFGSVSAAPFVLMGDANLDPEGGDGRGKAMARLLADPRLQDPLPGRKTVLWEDVGQLRVDYVLPSAHWRVTGAGLSPPNPLASRHRLVWVDLALP